MIQLISVIISFFTVLVAIIAIWIQHYQFNKNKEPLLAPALRTLEMDINNVPLDWTTGRTLGTEYSDTLLYLYNFGGSTVFNVGYTYTLVNKHEIGSEIENRNSDNANMKFGESLLNMKYKEKYHIVLNTEVKIRRVDLIKEGNKAIIYLPSFYLLLINHLYRDRLKAINFIHPILLLEITYQDIKYEKWKTKFELNLVPNINYKFKNGVEESAEISINANYLERKKQKK